MNEQARPPAFVEGKYIVTFVGTSSGVIECPTIAALRTCLEECYPNPGDPTRGFLLNPRNWQTHPTDDFPFFVETAMFTDEEDYRVFVARKCELTS